MDYKQSTVGQFSQIDQIESKDNQKIQIKVLSNGDLNKPSNDELIATCSSIGKLINEEMNGQSKEEESNQMDDSSIGNRSKINEIVQTNESNLNDRLDYGLNNLNQKMTKDVERDDFLIWVDYFMSVTLLSAKRSKDQSTQVEYCIVNNDNKIVSIGYNGMFVNCNDDLLPWGKSSTNQLDNKYLYVWHAELNCVLNGSTFSLKNCTIYVTLFPCNECAKVIIQVGIKKIYHLDKKKEEKPEYFASKRLLDMANVKLVHYIPKETEVVLK